MTHLNLTLKTIAIFAATAAVTVALAKPFWPTCALTEPPCNLLQGQYQQCWACCISHCGADGNCFTTSCQQCETCCNPANGC